VMLIQVALGLRDVTMLDACRYGHSRLGCSVRSRLATPLRKLDAGCSFDTH
jgi:hypothetical protein